MYDNQYCIVNFVLVADKKMPGAEKRSHYYRQYGNPNFGGTHNYFNYRINLMTL
jgi:hypothetical protein